MRTKAERTLERAALPNGLAPHWHHVAHVAPCGVLCNTPTRLRPTRANVAFHATPLE